MSLGDVNTYNYTLISVGVVSRHKVVRALGTKKSSEIAFGFEEYIKRMVTLITQTYFSVIMGLGLDAMWQSCLKTTMLTFEEWQQNTSKHTHTHTPFVEIFNEELLKQSIKLIDTQYRQDLQKILVISVENLNSKVNKMSEKKPWMNDMEPKDAIKLDIA